MRHNQAGDTRRRIGRSQLPCGQRPAIRWISRRGAGAWSGLEALPVPVNSPAAECCGAFAGDDGFYFSSTRDGSWDIFAARQAGTGYAIERLPGAVNSGETGIAPDESGRNGEWPSYADQR